MTAAVTASALSKHFGRVTAADGIQFMIEPGEIFGLVGPDGAGKTTIMRMIAGVLRPDSGTVMVDGINVGQSPEKAKAHISYMPQRFGLYEDLTVTENIAFFSDIFEVPAPLRDERVGSLLAASGMTGFRNRLAGKLSGGMKQKLGLICALIHTPRLLLLDEPTTGVDPVSRRDFWQILYSLRETGVTIVISTAYLDEAERCTRLALLHQGKLRYCDTPEGLKAQMPGVMLEITAPDPRAIRDTVSDLPGVANTLLMGDGVHIAADSPGRIDGIRQAISAQGLTITDIRQIEPSIEDLFVTLLGDGAAGK